MRARSFRGSTLLSIALLTACGNETVRESSPEFRNLAPGVAYVGLDACVACHQDIAATYSHTGMGRSFYPMSKAVEVEDFTRNNEIELPGTGLRYRMTERDGRYFTRQFALDSRKREMAVDEREMRYVVGSGNHSRTYLSEFEGKLNQMPVCWYPQDSVWDLCPGFEHKNDHFSREASNSCVFCHNARMEPVAGARNRYQTPYPAGIDCERCHGPGQLHVARWNDGKEKPTGGIDPTIVNPRRLPLESRIHVCFQCHLGDAKAGERVPRYDRVLESFRPGMLLTEVSVPMQYEQVHEGAFGLSAQADRLIASRCYRESGGKIECLTCHNPHVTTYDASRGAGFYRERCLGCHEVGACTAPQAARQATSPPDDCIDCHMRRAEPDDQRRTTFTDHWIRKRIEPPSHEVRTSIAFAPVFPRAFESMSDADQAFYRGRIRLLKSLETPPGVRNALWDEASTAFRAAIDKGAPTPEAWFFFGKTLTYQKRWDAAETALREARTRAPANRDAAFAFGRALAQQRKITEAAGVYEEMLRTDPRDPAALAELASCRLAQNRAAEALELYDRALLEDPRNAHLHANRAVILMAIGRRDEAAHAVLEATRLDPEDKAVWRLGAQILMQSGRREEAAEVDRRAQALSGRPVASETAATMD